MVKGSWREFDDLEQSKTQCHQPHSTQSEQKVIVQKVKAGKGGKTVTIVKGLSLNDSEARALLKSLKASCGTGGTVKKGWLELQGDQVINLIELLQKEGYRPKKSGG